MIDQVFRSLVGVEGVATHQGIEADLLTAFETEQGFHFPQDHGEILRWSNGIEAYFGYFRLFGIQSVASIDAVGWNNRDCWKFAWEDRCLSFWCFGETAWGDQYAYSIDSLHTGNALQVYFIDCLSMTPAIIALSFAEFLEKEFLRNAQDPYDLMIPKAKKKLGSLEVESHLVYLPSILLSGEEHIDKVKKMNGRAAMICNGDMATQLDNGPPNGSVTGVESYEDTQHRLRLRLVWS